MADQPSSSSTLKNSSLSSLALVVPDGGTARDEQGHFNGEFRLAAVRYAVGCGKSQRAAAADMGVSDKTLGGWINQAKPDAAGNIDVQRFDELAQLRFPRQTAGRATQTRDR